MAPGEQNVSFAGTVMIQLIIYRTSCESIIEHMETTPRILWLNYMSMSEKNMCFYKHVKNVEERGTTESTVSLTEMAQQFCSGLVSFVSPESDS